MFTVLVCFTCYPSTFYEDTPARQKLMINLRLHHLTGVSHVEFTPGFPFYAVLVSIVMSRPFAVNYFPFSLPTQCMEVEQCVDNANQVKPGWLQESFYIVVLYIENGKYHHPHFL